MPTVLHEGTPALLGPGQSNADTDVSCWALPCLLLSSTEFTPGVLMVVQSAIKPVGIFFPPLLFGPHLKTWLLMAFQAVSTGCTPRKHAYMIC